MAKGVQSSTGFHIDGVLDVYSVSSCVNDDFADYFKYWKHNGYWLFDSPEIIQTLARDNSIELDRTSLFYYECMKNSLGKAGAFINRNPQSQPISCQPQEQNL